VSTLKDFVSLFCRVTKYANDQQLFFDDFSAAYQKMGKMGATFA
jgi:hypothetical protein